MGHAAATHWLQGRTRNLVDALRGDDKTLVIHFITYLPPIFIHELMIIHIY